MITDDKFGVAKISRLMLLRRGGIYIRTHATGALDSQLFNKGIAVGKVGENHLVQIHVRNIEFSVADFKRYF